MKFENETKFYQGKVRDVWTISDKYIIMVASDRISAFDRILPKPIPYKGIVLNKIAEHFLTSTRDIIKNWLITSPYSNISIGWKCDPFPVEIVVRGYLSGHAWRIYKWGGREICGVLLPDGLNENDKLPNPIITPTTKAEIGHDIDISREEIISQNLVSEKHYGIIESKALELFRRGTEMAKERNLILVDTKYEFGLLHDEVVLIDEIHTPDSSRYFFLDTYSENQENNKPQKQLSKEFVRKWLIENNFTGGTNEQIPEMTESVIEDIKNRYIELYQLITGLEFNYPNEKIETEIINKIIESIQ